MSENIVDALRYAVDLNEYSEKIVTDKDGKEFYDRNKLTLVELNPKKYPRTLQLSSLTSLIDYLKSDLNDLSKQNLIVVVEDNKQLLSILRMMNLKTELNLFESVLDCLKLHLSVSCHLKNSISCCKHLLLTMLTVTF